jgi:hypothetical protein
VSVQRVLLLCLLYCCRIALWRSVMTREALVILTKSLRIGTTDVLYSTVEHAAMTVKKSFQTDMVLSVFEIVGSQWSLFSGYSHGIWYTRPIYFSVVDHFSVSNKPQFAFLLWKAEEISVWHSNLVDSISQISNIPCSYTSHAAGEYKIRSKLYILSR